MYLLKSKSLCIVLAITVGAVGLLFIENRQGYYLTHNIGLTSSSDKKKDIFHLRTPKEAGGAVGSNEDDGEEPHAAFETSGTSGVHISYYYIEICAYRAHLLLS